MRIIIGENPLRTGVIEIFRRHGVIYASLRDIAAECLLPFSEDPSARGITVGKPGRRLLLTAHPSVAYVEDASYGSRAYRLPADVVYSGNRHFVPLVSFIPFLGFVCEREVLFDAQTATLRLGKPQADNTLATLIQDRPDFREVESIFTPRAPSSENTASWMPGLFVDCPEGCDENFLKSELAFVNHVRDKESADVHLLVITKAAGNGGKEYTLTFVGYRAFSGMLDTIKFFTLASDTDDLIRHKLGNTIKLGLMRYIARTPLAAHARIDFPDWQEPAATRADPWNSWVFNTDISAELQGEQSSKYLKFGGSISANRVTETLKTRLGYYMSYVENRFEYSGATILAVARSTQLSSLFAMGLSEHWSVGIFGTLSSSTYDNTRMWANVGPALEFDIFPYSEHTRRQLPVTYRIGYIHARYIEETIYSRTAESLYLHSVSIGLDVKELWGTIHILAEGSQYLHDLSKYRLEFEGKFSFRLWEGLSLWTAGTVTMVRDQLGLPKSGASPEEVLLRQKELETGYYFYAGIGVSFTFGSIYSNIVNPRFGN